MPVRILLGDCLQKLQLLEDNSVHAIVTDPPYGLSFMGKKWDYDVPSVAIWEQCLRVLKPGGHLLAFAGTRTQHRMAVRIEDAGFEIRDMIAWVYGSGFPKSLDVSKAIDKAAGAEREVIGVHRRGTGNHGDGTGTYNFRGRDVANGSAAMESEVSITAPATEDAKRWHGWGTALKPALEPITVARKPLYGTVAENVLTHGCGGLNVDGCRVGTEGGTAKGSKPQGDGRGIYGAGLHGACEIKQLDAGRWPANLIHDGSDEIPLGDAARFFYCAKASKAERGEGNNHPTVKPIALMRYLCRLVCPFDGTVLDPFMGSGSTGVAATLEKLNFIGIELLKEHFETSKRRIIQAKGKQ